MRALVRVVISTGRAFLPLVCLWALTAIAASAQQPQTGDNPQRGFYPGGSYAVSEIETINVANGNLMLNIPLASLPAGPGGSPGPSVSLVYNSKIHNVWKEAPPREFNEAQEPIWNHLMIEGGGWRLQYPIYTVSYEDIRGNNCGSTGQYIWKVYVTFPDGSKHEFYPVGYDTYANTGYSAIRADGWMTQCLSDEEGNTYPHENFHTPSTMTYYSTDGSYLRLEVLHDSDSNWHNNQWVLYSSDGRKVEGTPNTQGEITHQRIYDRNNNYVEYQRIANYNGEPNHTVDKLSDQLGRHIIIEGNAVIASGVNGEELRWTMTWKNITVQNIYCARYVTGSCDPLDFYPFQTVSMIDTITLPTQAGGLTYQFNYNDTSGGWGELNYVKTPSGAEARYQYAEDGNTGIAWNRVLDNRPTKKELKYLREYDGSSTPTTEEWTYAFDRTTGTSTTTSPDGGISREYQYITTENTERWKYENKLVYKVERPDGSVTERLWQTNTPASTRVLSGLQYIPAYLNQYAKTEFTSIRDAGGGLAKTAVKDYSYDKNGNLTAVREYDWVGYGSIQRDVYGRPLDVPQQPALTSSVLKRVTSNTYYAQTPDASDTSTVDPDSYDRPGSARLLGVAAVTEVSDGVGILARTEFTYDDPSMRGNLTLQRSWDSTKGPLLGNAQSAVRLDAGNSISAMREYDENTTEPALRYGNLTLSVDANGNGTKYTYGPVTEPNGTQFPGLYPTTVVAATGTSVQRTSSIVYDFSTGLVTKVTDVDNQVSTSSTYDDLGRPTLVEEADNEADANNVSLERRTVTEYSDALRRVIIRSDLNTTGDGKLVSVQHYDQLGRMRLSRTLEDPAEGAENEYAGVKIQHRYLIDSTTHATYQLSSNPYRAAHSSEAGGEATMGWTLTTSDPGGRVVRVETFAGANLPAPFASSSPNSTPTGAGVASYDAEVVTLTDPAGKQRRSASDALGRLTQVFEAPSAAGYNYQTTYAYDVLDNLTQVVQGQQTRTFVYSSLSRLTSATNPEVCRRQAGQCLPTPVTYEYDQNGNPKKKTDPRLVPNTQAHVETTYHYDELNRITSRQYNDGTPNVTFVYDSQPLPDGAPVFDRGLSAGRLIAVIYGEGRLGSYAGRHDAQGRVNQSWQVTDTGTAEGVKTYPLSYAYYVDGRIKTEKYPSGKVIGTQYDSAGRVAGVRKAGGDYYAGGDPTEPNNTEMMKYTSHGALSAIKLGNGLWEHTTFNSRLQPTQIGLGASPSDSGKLAITYGYGLADQNNGNVRSQRIHVVGVIDLTQTYEYDEVNRLMSAREAPTSGGSDTWRQTYTYQDGAGQGGQFGNRRIDAGNDPATGQPRTTANVLTSLTPTISSSNNHFDDDQGFGYDTTGNVTQDPSHSYAYDAENRIVKVDGGWNGSTGVTYIYDGDGRRVMKVSTSEVTVFVYDSMGRVVAEYSTKAGSNGVHFLTQDSLGSVRVVTDSQGNADSNGVASGSRHDYLPFGEEIGAEIGGRATQPGYSLNRNVRQKFTGKEREDETGLDYSVRRYYSSTLGRFTSIDPLSGVPKRPQSWNAYAYVLNNPFKYLDPNGLRWSQRIIGSYVQYQWFPTDEEYNAAIDPNSDDYQGWTAVTFNENQAYTGTESVEEDSFGNLVYQRLTLNTDGTTSRSILIVNTLHTAVGVAAMGIFRYNYLGALSSFQTTLHNALHSPVAGFAGSIFPKYPPTPGGMTPNEFGKLVGWGSRDAAARERIANVTKEEIERMAEKGLTKDMARQWSEFYKEVKRIYPGNPSAAGRVEYMQHLSEVLPR